jgi:hypothetical protein
MTDFAEAFEEGLEAAQVSSRAKEEIQSIFWKLRGDISKKTNGKISIEIEFREPLAEGIDKVPGFEGLKTLANSFRSGESRIIASVSHGGESSEVVLARWSMDRAGYPCRLKWPGKEVICEDGEALENALAEFLRDPVVGEKFYSLLKIEETEG